MKNMKNKKSLLVTAVLTVIFFTGSARAADFATETQDLITQTITRVVEANINNAAAENVSGQTVVKDIQNSMMTKISDAVKQNTAARKRANVVQTCMECRVMQPIEVVVAGKSTLLSADVQERINQAMAKKIKETIRVISSDPAVARMVQDRMMVPRMAASPLRQDMQPFMMSKLLTDPNAMNMIGSQADNTNRQADKLTCTAGDAGFPNC
ncbi:MAG: hypothetical protein Q3M30_09080 [Candidatus Electrothrix sp. Rat3]|nr:hypothetical protein [Candidatus Electrothrix rattekaaiensis]